MKALRWIIALFLLLLAVAGIWFYLSNRAASQRSIDLSERIPESAYAGRVNTLELGRWVLHSGAGSLDSFKMAWSHLWRSPAETGMDLMTDPWIFGDSSHFSLAFRLSGTKKFRRYVHQVVGKHYRLDIDSSGGYMHCKPAGENWELAWNKEGHALLTIYNRLQPHGNIVRTFFTGEPNAGFAWIKKDVLAQFHIFNPDALHTGMQWMDSGTYDIQITGNRLTVNETAPANQLPDKPVSICLIWDQFKNRPDLISRLPVSKLLARLQIDAEFIQNQKAIYFTVDSIYAREYHYFTYGYDDDFNPVTIPAVQIKKVPDWQLRCYFQTGDTLKLLEQKWKSLGILRNNRLHIDQLIIPYSSGMDVVVCSIRESDADMVISAQSDKLYNHLAVNVAALRLNLEKSGIDLPEKYRLPVKLVNALEWSGKSGYIQFNEGEGTTFQALVKLLAYYAKSSEQ